MSADAAAAAAVLPVGFRFRPTDEELVRHYLKAKIAGRPHPDLLVISDVDLATCEPWDLPAKSVIKSDDPEWFFFAPRDRPKYPGTRHRSNRSTAAGYWKATGKDRLIRSKSPGSAGTLIGVKKTLVFHRGRAPRGHRTSWIIHEYTATEPNFQSGLNGSFVLYRLFNKQEGETPNPDPESPSTSSRGNPSQDDAIASMLRDNTLPSGLSQLTPTKIATDQSMARLLATVDDKEQATAQGDAFLDVLAQLPDLQPGQRYDGFGFPSISSPMRPYMDHPFVGNMGEQDFSAYFGSIIAEQDLQDLLLDPAYAKSDNKHPTGNAESNTTALVTSTDNSNNNVLFEHSWRNGNSDQVLLVQRADDVDATGCSSGINTLQGDASNDNHETRAETSMLYRGADWGSPLNSQYELQMGSQNSGALCPASSWTPYPQHLFDTGVEPSRSDMINSNALNGQGGWAAAPSSVPEFIDDPQQGNAARRIRLACGVERASACQDILTPCMESESDAEAGSCYSSGSSSNNHAEDYVNTASQTKVDIEGRGRHMPAQVDSSSVEEDMLEVARAKLLHRGANLKQRVIQGSSSRWATGNKEPRESSSRRPSGGCVVRYLRLALVVMVLVGVARLLLRSL